MSEENSSPEEQVASYTFPSGDTWYGPLQNGRPHGKGVRKRPDGKVCFYGHMVDGKLGRGVYIGFDGNRYEGAFKNGMAHGQAVAIFPYGDRYEGEYRNGHHHGRGKHTLADGRIYEGTWVKGKKDGLGTMTWPDGSKFEGKWEKDRRHGMGTMTWPDGDKFEGYWQHDKRMFGVEFDENGNKVYEGKWENDEPVLNELIVVSLDEECCICHGGYTLGDSLLVTGCQAEPRHVFHKRCLEEWLNQGYDTCPRCRRGGLKLPSTDTDERDSDGSDMDESGTDESDSVESDPSS